MADTRCANPAYQLDVDEMVLEYLVYNTLTAHIDEWNPNYRHAAKPVGRTTENASRLLSSLDTSILLFKANHLHQGFSSSTDFYLQLLEFLLLFTHRRGGPSSLSEESYRSARSAGQQNIKHRLRCWKAYEASQQASQEDKDLLAIRAERYVGNCISVEDDHGVSSTATSKGIPLVDLLPRFMDLSAQIVQLTQQEITEKWLTLANDFMLQAAVEVVTMGHMSPHNSKIDPDALLASFGWGLPAESNGDCGSSNAEDNINDMLLPSTSETSSRSTSWVEWRRRTVGKFMEHIHPVGEEAESRYLHENDKRYRFSGLQYDHPADGFEVQVLDYVKNLQVVWAQLKEEPILLQIERGGLEGLDDTEFQAFMDRVGGD